MNIVSSILRRVGDSGEGTESILEDPRPWDIVSCALQRTLSWLHTCMTDSEHSTACLFGRCSDLSNQIN